ncbi:MAG: hypothetical protein ABS36_11160 [Acidobacteria bacterium SCN 69-37]|nr:MAG: hypothetical protein ABS36_11160 [Acidobacteria bacterium SCN 69-37]
MSRGLVVTYSLALAVLVGVTPAAAQEVPRLDLSGAFQASAVVPPVLLAPEQLPRSFDPAPRRPGRSALMTSLYASTAVMQALDVHSTLLALDRGAVEANPLMSGPSRNKAAFIAIKAGVAFSSVMAARNMSKRNKLAAALTLVAINSVYATIINHNYGVARRQQ